MTNFAACHKEIPLQWFYKEFKICKYHKVFTQQ